MSELKDKTAKGIGWSFADTLSSTGILAIVNIVLARILSPSEFGIVGMTAFFITLSTSLTDGGFSGALIRKKNVDQNDFNTVFYTQLLISILLYLILFFTAPYIAVFFKTPILSSVIRILSLSIIISAFTAVQKVILFRKIDFKTQTIVSLVSSLTCGTVGIVMALKGYGVWSLVVLQLSRMFVSSLMFWILSSWKPSFSFSVRSFKEMFSFGGKLLATSLISNFWNEATSVIIGRFYNTTQLGYYSRADKFRNMVTSAVGMVMQRVSYPVLSTIQDERERQRRAFAKLMKTTVLITFTSVLGLAAISKSLIWVLIGEKWMPAVPYLQILSISGLFIPTLYIFSSLFSATGRSDYNLKTEIYKILLLVGPILLGCFYSIDLMLWGMVGAYLLSYLIQAYYVSKLMNYTLWQQVRDLCPFLLIAIIMAVPVWCINLLEFKPLYTLLLQLFVGVSIIILIYEKCYHCEEYTEIKSHITDLFHRKSKS